MVLTSPPEMDAEVELQISLDEDEKGQILFCFDDPSVCQGPNHQSNFFPHFNDENGTVPPWKIKFGEKASFFVVAVDDNKIEGDHLAPIRFGRVHIVEQHCQFSYGLSRQKSSISGTRCTRNDL